MKKQFLIIAILILLVVAFIRTESLIITQNLKANLLQGIRIFSPIHNHVYDNRMISINISMNDKGILEYVDSANRERFITLCRNCNDYGYKKLRQKPFDDGFHELTFFAMLNSGFIYQGVNFTVDTRKPIIIDTEPKKGFASGDFEVEFEEASPISLFLNYGNDKIGYQTNYLNIEDSCYFIKRNRMGCKTNVELNDYDQQEIAYSFELTDILNKYAVSKFRKLKVDFTPPIINNLDSFWYLKGSYVYFNINVSEPNFYRIEYQDLDEKNPKWRALCISLKDNICKIRKNFSKGEHDLLINLSDKAGNYDTQEIIFEVE